MNLHNVNDIYFNQLFKQDWHDDIKGKVLLVDKSTMSIISMCYGQSQLLEQDIILIELIDNYRQLDQMKHLNCIVYIKPVLQSIELLNQELQSPHFNNYKVFFNNIINKTQLEKIAESDKFEVISNVTELFQDYFIINNNLFRVPVDDSIIDETNKLISLLLSIKKFPIIKFENNSISLKKLSSEILYQINSNLNNNLFDNLNVKSESPPVLLLFDRFNDPITPLLHPWTYQSMIHELIGINKNIIEIGTEKILLNDRNDDFFNSSIYSNYGDLTDSFSKKVEAFKKESNTNVNTSNLLELKKILTRLPDFQKKSSNIIKHLNILSELDSKIQAQKLWELSELQQTIICKLDTQTNIENSLIQVLVNDHIDTNNKIKLILLYTIQFNDSNINRFINMVHDLSLVQLKLLNNFHKKFAHVTQSFTKKEPENNFKKFFKNFSNSNEVDNIYLQYTPPLKETLQNFISHHQTNFNTLVPDTLTESSVIQDIIVYFKNGITYEEARIVEEINRSHNTINLIVGSDKVINSTEWLSELYNHID